MLFLFHAQPHALGQTRVLVSYIVNIHGNLSRMFKISFYFYTFLMLIFSIGNYGIILEFNSKYSVGTL